MIPISMKLGIFFLVLGFTSGYRNGDDNVDIGFSIDPCSLPILRGNCKGYSQQWAFDGTKCLSFVYTGCRGNLNRFPNENSCKTSCFNKIKPLAETRPGIDYGNDGDRRPETLPAIVPIKPDTKPGIDYGKDNDRQPVVLPAIVPINPNTKPFFEYGNDDARKPVVLPAFETRPEIRPAPDVLIKPITRPIEKCQLPVAAGRCRGYAPSWHYDAQASTCKRFIYTGCQGNENRFESEATCLKECGIRKDTLPIVEPIKPGQVRPLPGGGRQLSRCLQRQDGGICFAYMKRWHYDGASGTCQQFVYGGCGGNENNFLDEATCLDVCRTRKPQIQPPIIDYGNQGTKDRISPVVRPGIDKCTLSVAPGNCKGYQKAWHYDSVGRSCKEFVYTGCRGNENRFVSERACSDSCRPKPEKNVERKINPGCTQPLAIGSCKAHINSWHFDANSGKCKPFVYSGCKGNRNRFSSERICNNTCQLTPVGGNY